MELLVFVLVVEDDAISITVQGAAAVVWTSVRRWRGRLGGLDVVGTALKLVRSGNVELKASTCL